MIINYLALFGIHGQWYCILCVLHIYQYLLAPALHYLTWHFTIMLHCEKHLLRLISSIFRVTTREKSAQTWIWLQPVNRIITSQLVTAGQASHRLQMDTWHCSLLGHCFVTCEGDVWFHHQLPLLEREEEERQKIFISSFKTVKTQTLQGNHCTAPKANAPIIK